jgi:hypothetical protein
VEPFGTLGTLLGIAVTFLSLIQGIVSLSA